MPDVDPMAPIPIMAGATIDADTARDAMTTLAKRGALDLAEMLGLTGQATPRTGHMKPALRATHHVMSREVKGVRPA